VIRTEEEHLAHYGILRRSGRYPWGSGSTENSRNKRFLDIVAEQRKSGMSDAEIARHWGISRNELTAARTIALAQQKRGKIMQAQRLKDKGWSNVAIGQRMGLNESSVRALLSEGELAKTNAIETTANMLKAQVDEKGMIDIGKGVEHHVNVTRTRLDTAVAVLKEQGYNVHTIYIPQASLPGQFTPMKVLVKPGISQSEVNRRRSEIKQITQRSEDNGKSFLGIKPPISVDSSRIKVNYGPDGGSEADGVIYVRRGVKDLQIGSKNYAQVRIAVDGTHYMKGMAIYKDDMPPGVDLIFNTNKGPHVPLKSSDPKASTIFKPMAKDAENPFGSLYTQVYDDKGNVSSVMNLVNEEGSWDKWSKTLSSQMLSKQSPELAKQQLNLTYERRRREYAEISSLTNPIVRRELLIRFGDSTDSAAVHLKAANLPRQATKVILPIQSIKPTEVYAPSMRNGEKVVLVRHPHGGTFEIPQLTVNNRNPEAKKILGNAQDAIGIHHTVAQRLSGADFDGDTVLVIPNNKKQVTVDRALEGLKDFDPQIYAIPPGSPIPRISPVKKQSEMGKVSNLITDMTLQGATNDEKARAIRHSMVVIDSEKHNLDYKQSEIDNGIASLKEKYQGRSNAGAATLISRAGAEARIPEVRPRSAKRGGPIDPATGKRILEPTGRTREQLIVTRDPITGKKVYTPTGVRVPIVTKAKRLAITDDAFELVDSPAFVMETIYATHSNKLKAMANAARKDALQIKAPPADPVAKRHYSSEVSSLNAKLRLSERNAPLERQAQLIANTYVSQRRRANPLMEDDEIKKVKQQALKSARIKTGAAEKQKIIITPSEWNAIQAGAVAPTKLQKILEYSDLDTVKALALPKKALVISTSDKRRAESMLRTGYTQAEVADALGVGLTTLKVSLSE
jgi:lambda repressor-like predicted transcriptional regulator